MKKTALIFTLLFLFLLCGCTGYREINRGYIATAIGFAQNNGEFNIIIETISSSDVSDKPSERLIISCGGDSIEKAFEDLKLQLVKPVYFEQLGSVVLQQSLNQIQQQQIIDYLKINQGINYGVYLVKTADVSALFEMQTHSGVLGYDIIGLINNFKKQGGKNIQNQIYQVERRQNTTLPVVTVTEDKLSFEIFGENK